MFEMNPTNLQSVVDKSQDHFHMLSGLALIYPSKIFAIIGMNCNKIYFVKSLHV